MSERTKQIEQRLRAVLEPTSLMIEDDSHLHVGHAGARGGAGHYGITVVSDKFHGLTTVERHRLVYDAVRDMMPAEIHALRITAHAPDEI